MTAETGVPTRRIVRSPLLSVAVGPTPGLTAEWTHGLVPVGTREVAAGQVVELHVTVEAAARPIGETTAVRFDIVTEAHEITKADADRIVRLMTPTVAGPQDGLATERLAPVVRTLTPDEAIGAAAEAFRREHPDDVATQLLVARETSDEGRVHLVAWWTVARPGGAPGVGITFAVDIDGSLRGTTTEPLHVGEGAADTGTIQLVLQHEDGSPMRGADVAATFSSRTVGGITDEDGRLALDVPAAEDEVFSVLLRSYPITFVAAPGPVAPPAEEPSPGESPLAGAEPGASPAEGPSPVLEPPTVTEPRPTDSRPEVATVFAFDSAFPGPAVLARLRAVAAKSEAFPDRPVMVFGHTDRAGSVSYNQGLSERRARAIAALLSADRDAFDALAVEERWEIGAYQAMLHGLGCNPGPIDGQRGPMVEAAVRAFQAEYNEGVFHRGPVARAHPDLGIDGKLGSDTQAAIRDSYVTLAPHLPPERFAEPSMAGCGKAHPVSERDADNRRAVVAFVAPAAEPGDAPCDAYESLVGELPTDLHGPRFVDFAWLRAEGGPIHLSAATTVPDGTPVQFTVIRCEQRVPTPLPESSTVEAPPTLGPTLATLAGIIKGGVAFARWTPPAGENLLDPERWLVDLDVELEVTDETADTSPGDGDPGSAEGLLAAIGVHPPVFLVEANGHWAISGPPGARLDRLRFSDEDHLEGMGLGSDGSLVPFTTLGGHAAGAGSTAVLAVGISERSLDLAVALPPPPPPPPQAPVLDPTRWGPIIATSSSAFSRVRTANAVKSLVDGWDTYREMVAAIRTAVSEEHFIYLLGWSLVDDFDLLAPRPAPGATARPTPAPPGSETIQKLFADASARRVQVRAMLWDQVGTANSAQVRRISALPTGAAILDNETPHPIVSFGSHHQKVLVVKGSEGLIAFVGGLDINNDRTEPVGSGHGNPQHDDHCRIVGPAAFDLLQTFILRWDHHPGSPAIDTAKGALLGRAEPVPAPITTPPPGSSSIPGTCSVRIARTFNPTTGRGPARCERDIQDLLVLSIRSARRFIYIEDQYLVNRLAAVELNRAVRRLQHVTMLTTASEILVGSGEFGSGGLPCAWKMRRDFVADLIAGLGPADVAKLRIFILVTPPPTAVPPVFGFHTYVHAKSWVFDDELAVIGSANVNRRSWTHDSEVNAFVFDDARPTGSGLTFAQQYRMQLWAEHLDVAPAVVADGVTSAGMWLSPSARAHVRRYDPTASSDRVPDFVCSGLLNRIDPSMTCPQPLVAAVP